MSARSTWGQIPSEPRGQIYTDNGVSGAKDSRPALNRLMADAGQRKFDTVLVWKLDRFGRSLRHLINALAELEARGIAFVSLRDNLDLGTPSGRLMFQIIGAMAEFERALIQERVKAGLRHARSEFSQLPVADDTPGAERRRFPQRRLGGTSTVWQLGVHADFGSTRDSAPDIIQPMRTLVWTLLCFVICTIGCQAQHPEDQVLAVYRQLEKAVQSGDANDTFIGLWSREKASEAEKMRLQLHPQPDVHYTSSKVFVQGDEAVLLGQYGQDGFLSVRFVKEDGRWKIKDFAFSDKAYPAESVYAMIPPAPGAFERAGAPWQNVAPALDKANAAKQGWQVRATYDESFLYVRIESSRPIPAPGSQAEKPPMGWPVMKVGVSGVGEFVLHATANIGDQATFDESGRANSHRHYVAYWLMLEHADQMIFQAWAGLHPDPLVQAGDHFFDVRVPLRTMGVADARHTKITIGDAQWPKSAIFSLEVQPYRDSDRQY